MTTTPEELRATLNGQAQRIRDDSRLTQQTKTANIAKLYLRAKSEMAAMEANHAADQKREKTKKVRMAFGHASPESQRAAFDVVDKIDVLDSRASQRAEALMTQAIELGDDSLVSAVAFRAREHGWDDALEQWATVAKPGQVEALNDLRNTEKPTAATMFEFAVPAPIEVSHTWNDYQLQELADADPNAVQVGS